jgi:hypothetical protein
MDSVDEVEEKLKAVKEIRDVEKGIMICQASRKCGAFIYSIRAEDAAESERSLEFKFSPESSGVLFEQAEKLLTERLAQLKAKIGAA